MPWGREVRVGDVLLHDVYMWEIKGFAPEHTRGYPPGVSPKKNSVAVVLDRPPPRPGTEMFYVPNAAAEEKKDAG